MTATGRVFAFNVFLDIFSDAYQCRNAANFDNFGRCALHRCEKIYPIELRFPRNFVHHLMALMQLEFHDSVH
jgi:hypothetical protein